MRCFFTQVFFSIFVLVETITVSAVASGYQYTCHFDKYDFASRQQTSVKGVLAEDKSHHLTLNIGNVCARIIGPVHHGKLLDPEMRDFEVHFWERASATDDCNYSLVNNIAGTNFPDFSPHPVLYADYANASFTFECNTTN